MAKPAEATLGDISLNRLAVCECSDFNVCFVLEPFGVSDGPLSLHVVQQPEGVTLQKYPQTRLLVILVEEVV